MGWRSRGRRLARSVQTSLSSLRYDMVQPYLCSLGHEAAACAGRGELARAAANAKQLFDGWSCVDQLVVGRH